MLFFEISKTCMISFFCKQKDNASAKASSSKLPDKLNLTNDILD